MKIFNGLFFLNSTLGRRFYRKRPIQNLTSLGPAASKEISNGLLFENSTLGLRFYQKRPIQNLTSLGLAASKEIFNGPLFENSTLGLRFYQKRPIQNLTSLGLAASKNSRYISSLASLGPTLASLGPSIYQRAETGVFLDIENCDVPENEAPALRQSIEKSLRNEGYNGAVSICVVGNMELSVNRRVAYRLLTQGASVCHIHPNQKKPKEASDKLLIAKMFEWALCQKSPGNLMLVSGDGDYVDSLLVLQKNGFNIMIVFPVDKGSLKLLQIAQSKVWMWSTFSRVKQRDYSQEIWLDLKKFVISEEEYCIGRSLDQSKARTLVWKKCLNYISLGHVGLVLHLSFNWKGNISSYIALSLEGMSKKLLHWSPNDNNGRTTCVAIAGSDYCVMAAYYPMSTGHGTLPPEDSNLHELEKIAVLSSSSFPTDVKALKKDLISKNRICQQQQKKRMNCPAMAQLLSNTFYLKRFFPYYAFNLLGGLDEEGKGCVFTYDAFGSCERVGYGAQGSGSTLIMPFLDKQLKSLSPRPAQDCNTSLSEAEAVHLIEVVFAATIERDIYTGAKLEIKIVKAHGIHTRNMDLSQD